MGGVGRHGVLAIESPDPVLSVVGPIGLAASVGTGLVIDLLGGLAIDAPRTLADLVESGPTRAELSPGRTGVALLPGAHVAIGDAAPMIEELAAAWPAVVVRVGPETGPFATVPLRAIYPGVLRPDGGKPAVWQPVGAGARPPGPGPVLPRLGGSAVRRMLAVRQPRSGRWVRGWRRVWDLPWA